MKLNDTFTIGAWVYRSLALTRLIVHGPTGIGQFGFYINGNLLPMYLRLNNGENYITSLLPSLSNTWTHAAVSYNGTGNVVFYLNGVKKSIATINIPIAVRQPPPMIQIGYGDLNPLVQLQGSIACLTVYERALTQSEVTLMKNSCP